jgi:lipopolysaccharide heptosyltransferase II
MRGAAAATLRPGERVLVTRLDYLGDVVLSLPLVDALRVRAPGVEIDYLARRPGADLLARDARFARVWALERGALPTLALVRALRARRYRAVVDLYSNPRSAWLSWSTGAPVRVGGNRRGRRHLYTHPTTVTADVRRVTDVFMRYGAPLGVPTSQRASKPALAVAPDELERAERLLAAAGATTRRPRVGIHPGGKWTVKRWPAERFAELAGVIERELGAHPVVFTGPNETEATDRVRAGAAANATFLAPLPIRSVAAVVARLDAMVACDGGVMHVAAAVGTPTVGIFGSSEPAVWFPYENEGPFRAAYLDVECRPCHRHTCPLGHTRCLNELAVAEVARRLREVMARAREAP